MIPASLVKEMVTLTNQLDELYSKVITKYMKSVVSPIQHFLAAILLVFTAEEIIMLIMPDSTILSDIERAVLDSSLLVLVLFPLLYIIIYRPLKNQKLALENSKQKLQASIEELAINQCVLRDTIRDLEREGHHKSRFLSNMSHELRSPLNSILILSRLLSENRQENLSEQQIEFAHIILSAGSDLLSLIDEVLDLARIEAGRMQVYVDRIQLVEFADILEKEFRLLVQENNLNFHIEIMAEAPDIIWTDRQRLHQILRNLIHNALKFTRYGEIRVLFRALNLEEHAYADMSDKDIWCSIDIIDTGIGIPKEQLFNIFEPFRQLDDGENRKFSGSGLGLSICHELATLLGGKIRVESQEGKGSTFTFILPSIPLSTADGTSDNRSPVSVERDLASLRDDRRILRPYDKSILVVSRDRLRAHSLFVAAHEMGFSVLVAGDEKAALFLADYYQPSATIIESSDHNSDDIKLTTRLQFGAQGNRRPMLFLVQPNHLGITITSDTSVQIVSLNQVSEPWLSPVYRFLSAINENYSLTGKQKEKLETRKIEKHPLAGRRILLVENDVIDIFSLTNLLQENGATVIIAKNAAEGLQCLKETKKLDIILTENKIPDMEEYEFLRTLRKDPEYHHYPVIVVTSQARPGERQRCLDSGAAEYIPKPVDPPKLISMINILLLNERTLPDETVHSNR